jgi:hypothetical protein
MKNQELNTQSIFDLMDINMEQLEALLPKKETAAEKIGAIISRLDIPDNDAIEAYNQIINIVNNK